MSSDTMTLLNRENNARRLTEMRFVVANIGNESIRCPSSFFHTSIPPPPSGHTPPSSSPPTSSPPPRPSSSKPGTVQQVGQEGPRCWWERVFFHQKPLISTLRDLNKLCPAWVHLCSHASISSRCKLSCNICTNSNSSSSSNSLTSTPSANNLTTTTTNSNRFYLFS